MTGTQVTREECVSCHLSDYEATTNPIHEGLFPTTCADCHSTSGWVPALGGAGADTFDPARDLIVDTLQPRYSGTSIASLTPESQTLHMPMMHTSSAIDPRANESCTNCHSDTGAIFPGVFHSSIDSGGFAQPTECTDCHQESRPTGFVGAIDDGRAPPSGPMKHDAVVWRDESPTENSIVIHDCGVCHVPAEGWSTAAFHEPLDDARLEQPESCLDCHANSRPETVLTSANSSLAPGLEFDHSVGEGMRDCALCHASTTSWEGGSFHRPDDVLPPACSPCHEGERPTSDEGWESRTYTDSPFDYGTNTLGITHGGGQDCIGCHTGGDTGGTTTWVGGVFGHGSDTIATMACVSCHVSQRPDLVLGEAEAAALLPNGFNHALNGTGDCFGCHQATVVAGRYVDYFNDSGTLPGGDWKDGAEYPGVFVSSTTVHITVDEIRLHRSGPYDLVTSTSTATTSYYNGMLHTSTAIPAAISPGTSPTEPNEDSCWHCHASTGTTIESFSDGVFHEALEQYRATPSSPVTPLPPPDDCIDCHWQMRPNNIVELDASPLRPMDHRATFVSPVTIDGTSAAGVEDVDCHVCHGLPGMNWADGVFHDRIGSAVPADCTMCHYPTMATTDADRTSGTEFSMRHRSAEMTFQGCDQCHSMALARSTMSPAFALWDDGEYHGSVAMQPGTCVDCHTVSEPTTTTQSAIEYVMPQGSTPTNAGQYMSHQTSYVTSRDCAACHDAAPSPSWNEAPFHESVAPVTDCSRCHGLSNGLGSTPGTGNNMPAGVIDTETTTTASSGTGVSGRPDQIDHADVNVTGHDCDYCHNQIGPSTDPATRDREWLQATFHSNFTVGSSLVINTTTGRCDHCHTNVRPTAVFTGFNHDTIGGSDCSACHSFPGAGTVAMPNWQGATGGAPATISVGGFTIPAPPAPSPTTQTGIANLPHPASGECSTCHTDGGGRMAIGYDHASNLIDGKCNACHEAGSDLIGTPWNGATNQSAGDGDTRPWTLPSVRATFSGNSATETAPNHFYPVDCEECHEAPAGVATGLGDWRFDHDCRQMTPVSTCRLCHTRTKCE